MGITADLIHIVVAALLGGAFAHALRQPLVCGYILAGIIVGPHTGGVTIQNPHDIEMLAELGVALLLFTLGLEISIRELRSLAPVAFIAAPLQILGCTAAGYIVATLEGLSRVDSIWIGAAVSLSSTMVVVKTMMARRESQGLDSGIMLEILLVQDIAIVPLLILLPQVASNFMVLVSLLRSIALASAFIVFMYVVGTYICPPIFRAISRVGSRELFFLSTLSVALGAGMLAHQAGVSFAIGSFIAGIALSQTEFTEEALADISALRDLFGLVFFVSIGMLVDPIYFISHIGPIGALTLAIITSKAVIIAGTVGLLGYPRSISWIVGLGLAQIGEFAFVIMKVGNANGELSFEAFSLMISATVVSMIATPALFWAGAKTQTARL